jgi:hypothetical protein
MNAICDDLEMKCVGSFSAAMYDLLSRKGKQTWTLFASDFFEGIQTHVPTAKRFSPVLNYVFDYVPGPVGQKVSIGGKRG